MPVTLAKIIDGNAVVSDDLPNAQIVACPQCNQTYRLGYSDTEWHRLKDWQPIAQTALRRDHSARHEADAIPLAWPRVSRKR